MPQCTRERQGTLTLLDICLEVHMDTVGSSEIPSDDTRVCYIDILEDALTCWEPAVHSPYFDECVRKLIQETLRERYERDRKRFDAYLKAATETVNQWPEWKQRILG